jgi:hypothetical protein
MENILNWMFPITFYLLNRMRSDSLCCSLFILAGALVDVVLVPPRLIVAVFAVGEAAGRWAVVGFFKLLSAFIGIAIVCAVIHALTRVILYPLFLRG